MNFFAPLATAVVLWFNQSFEAKDLAVVGLLIVLEGVLSIDNALVLGLLAKKLPKHLQSRALTYGLVGAFVFRLIAIATASLLLKWWIVKFIGGAYLVYVAVSHLFFEKKKEEAAHKIQVDSKGHPVIPENGTTETPAAAAITSHTWLFWSTVGVIELTDIAFAIDSILAAIALVEGGSIIQTGLHPKLWVVVLGGFLGVVLMRFAAIVFIRLLEKFPRFETAAYLLVMVIGGKLLVDWYFNRKPEGAPEGWHGPADFHSPESAAFWVFWVLMLMCFAVGFIPKREKQA